jgi:hypothetical protein
VLLSPLSLFFFDKMEWLDLVVGYSANLEFLAKTGGSPENPFKRKLSFKACWERNSAKLAPMPHLSSFCFPRGAVLSDREIDFSSHSFVLNLISGNIVYGFCATFSVEISREELAVAKWVRIDLIVSGFFFKKKISNWDIRFFPNSV